MCLNSSIMQENINEVINKKIDLITRKNNIYHTGTVVRINEFVVEATGLEDAFYFEKVFVGDESNIGYVDKIERNKVVISLVKSNGNIKVGDNIITTQEPLEAYFSKDSIGMVVDPFGYDKMSGKKINNSIQIPIETEKIGIMDRTAVKRPLETGIAGIDLMFPIGRGQRQLIIGDKKTGKTQICLDTIVNQKGKNVICIYVAIGKTKKELKNVYAKLVEKGAHAYTVIVAAFNDDLTPLLKLTPYAALSMAEIYLKEGYDVLVVIDDLKKHADACREIALLSDKNTGRDAYPADIFYTHSRLLEKGCQYKNGGSITILPIVETKSGDITDYISTNIISITDGQIVLSEKMFKKGQKPAINFGLSVSRLGGAVQKDSIKILGARVRQELLSYLEVADVYQLVNIEQMSPELREKMKRGKRIMDLLKQPKFSPINEEELLSRFSDASINNEINVQEENINNTPVVETAPVVENAVPEIPIENIQPMVEETAPVVENLIPEIPVENIQPMVEENVPQMINQEETLEVFDPSEPLVIESNPTEVGVENSPVTEEPQTEKRD